MGYENMLTFGGHLEVLRRMLYRIFAVIALVAVTVFYFKEAAWDIILAPSDWQFCTYRWLEKIMQVIGMNFHFDKYYVNLIATNLSSQFMAHVTTALYLGLLGTSPYLLYELFHFISPALYENEKKYSVKIAIAIYLLFIFGVLMNYFVLFPISFRFLGTYSVSPRVVSNITLDSYISTFVSLTLIMGIAFQLPIISFFLAKMGAINSKLLVQYRKHSFIIIMLVAAIITPPDIMTLILVTLPLYLLFEVSIMVVRRVDKI